MPGLRPPGTHRLRTAAATPTEGSRRASSPHQSPVPPRFIGACSAGSLPNQARQKNDVTVVEVYEPPPRMVVRAKGWPIGEARVTIDVKPRGRASMVRIQQEAVAGPGRLIPRPCWIWFCTGATPRPCNGLPTSRRVWPAHRRPRPRPGDPRRRRASRCECQWRSHPGPGRAGPMQMACGADYPQKGFGTRGLPSAKGASRCNGL